MRFLRRAGSSSGPSDFWSWWSDGRHRVAEAITTGGFDERLVNEIGQAVQTIHPAMAWELAPGRSAQHAFCISPEGNAELRQGALRWLASAPPPDETWEYHASRQASPSLSALEVGGTLFELSAMRAIASWDESRRRVDVRLWHPQFAAAPQPVRLQASFLFLDNLIGEDAVERWIGQIDLLENPTDGRTPDELRAEIERHSSDPASDETWVVGELTRPDGSMAVVTANAALKRIDHPFADHHVPIEIVFGVNRMPTDTEAATLNAWEDDLLRRLGDLAIYAGRETTPGSRTLHFVAQDPDAMRPAIDSWAQGLPDTFADGLPQLRLRVNMQRDMDWSFQRELGVR